MDKRVGGNRAKLTSDQIEQVQATLHGYTPDQKWGVGNTVGGQFWTLADVRRLVLSVHEDCGVVFDSPTSYRTSYRTLYRTSYRTLLDTCDMTYQQTQGVYKHRSAHSVAEFDAQLEKN